MLKSLGIGQKAEDVYRALLGHTAGTVDELATSARLSPAEVSRELKWLVAHGMAVEPGGESRSLPEPVPPASALRTFLRGQRAAVEQAELAVDTLAGGLLSSGGSALPPSAMEVLVGSASVGSKATELVASAEREVLLLDAPPYAVGGNESGGGLDAFGALERGVGVRVVFSQQGLDLPGRMASVSSMVDAGVQARVLEHVPTKLLVVDGAMALVPALDGPELTHRALVIRDVLLHHVLLPFFERLWDAALPLGGGLEHHPSTDERQLLAMLASGMKDEVIARQLGVHVRTARRRITELLKSSTRARGSRRVPRPCGEGGSSSCTLNARPHQRVSPWGSSTSRRRRENVD